MELIENKYSLWEKNNTIQIDKSKFMNCKNYRDTEREACDYNYFGYFYKEENVYFEIVVNHQENEIFPIIKSKVSPFTAILSDEYVTYTGNPYYKNSTPLDLLAHIIIDLFFTKFSLSTQKFMQNATLKIRRTAVNKSSNVYTNYI